MKIRGTRPSHKVHQHTALYIVPRVIHCSSRKTHVRSLGGYNTGITAAAYVALRRAFETASSSSSARMAAAPECGCGDYQLPKLTFLPQLSGRHLSNQSTRFPKKVSDLPAFLNSFTGICTMPQSILIVPRSAGPGRAAMHTAAPFSTYRGRHAWLAGARLRPTAGTRSHGLSVTMMHGHYLSAR
jgi:hypothetical protein